MAAESARAMARRHQQIADRYARGADGEDATAGALAALAAQGWVLLHDVGWPGRPLANIDHVVVGPPGVFVIDSKNWSGRVGVERGVLRQNGRARTAAVTAAGIAAAAVAELMPGIPPQAVRAVLAFTEPIPPTAVGDVVVCSTTTIIAALTSQPAHWSSDQVQGVGHHLRRELVTATARRPTPRSVRRTPGRSRGTRSQVSRPSRRRRGWTAPVRPLAGLALAATALLNPGIFISGAERVSQLFVDQLTPSIERLGEPADPVQKPTPANERLSQDERGERSG